MPATNLVIFETSGVLAAHVAASIGALPVRMRESRTLEEFEHALDAGPFPVAILAVGKDESLVSDLLAAVNQRGGASVVVGNPKSWPQVMELRELGVLCILPPDLPLEKWRSLLRRLVDRAQEKTRQCSNYE